MQRAIPFRDVWPSFRWGPTAIGHEATQKEDEQRVSLVSISSSLWQAF
jgi:hypothetical protein